MARREDMDWRMASDVTTKFLLYIEDGMGCLKWSGYSLRQASSRLYVVEFRDREIDRFTCRTDARLYCELRAEIDMEELTTC